MAEYRVGRGWSDAELSARLGALEGLGRNFDPAAVGRTPDWRSYATETVVAREDPGPPAPAGPFQRARDAVTRYEFSDPSIVVAHFDPSGPLDGRRILLELKVLGLRYLVGAVVSRVREREGADESVFGFRYDTLEGHIERGCEWFLLTKSHATGEIHFRIAADWQPGDFPNAWSRLGFRLLGRRYQRRWTRRCHLRLRRLLSTRSARRLRGGGRKPLV